MNVVPIIRRLSNRVQIAADTGNKEELYAAEAAIDKALADCQISVHEHAELAVECSAAIDVLAGNDYLDEVFAAARLEGEE